MLPRGDRTGIGQVVDLARGFVDSGFDAGISLFVARDGEVLLEEAVGSTLDGQPLTVSHRFLYLSASKALTGATVALLHEAGLLAYGEPLVRAIPELAGDDERRQAITVHHLLTHQAGISDLFGATVTFEDWYDWDGAMAKTAAIPLEHDPGAGVAYHALSFGLLGLLVPRLDGRAFADFFAEEVAQPLGMDGVTWGLPSNDVVPWTRTGLPGRPGTDGAVRLQTPDALRAVVPAGGAWGTARDLGRFYLGMSGAVPGWLSAAERRRMSTPFTVGTPAGVAQGYGLAVGGPPGGTSVFGELAGPRTFGHPGMRCTVGWHDPDSGIVCAILCNGTPALDEGQRRLSILSDAVHRAAGRPFP